MFTFIELPTFASVRDKYLDDEEFADLQAFLIQQPEAGDVIPGSGAVASCAGQPPGVASGAGYG